MAPAYDGSFGGVGPVWVGPDVVESRRVVISDCSCIRLRDVGRLLRAASFKRGSGNNFSDKVGVVVSAGVSTLVYWRVCWCRFVWFIGVVRC